MGCDVCKYRYDNEGERDTGQVSRFLEKDEWIVDVEVASRRNSSFFI